MRTLLKGFNGYSMFCIFFKMSVMELVGRRFRRPSNKCKMYLRHT